MLPPTEREKFVAEKLDDKRTVLYCGKHMYSANPGTSPTPGCRDCNMVFWMHEAAGIPPHERRERLERLRVMLHHMAEDIEAGRWDYQPFDKPEIISE